MSVVLIDLVYYQMDTFVAEDEAIWGHCDLCDTDIIYCPRCCNNTCNGCAGSPILGEYDKKGTYNNHCHMCIPTHKVWKKNHFTIPSGKKLHTYEEALEIVKKNNESKKFEKE